MEALRIKATEISPEITFIPSYGRFEICGQSIMTGVEEFYAPLVAWLEAYAQKPAKEVTFSFDLNYYNLASSKRFMFIMYQLDAMKNNGSEVKVEWQYVEDDEFMKEFGEDLQHFFDVEFIIKPGKQRNPQLKMAC